MNQNQYIVEFRLQPPLAPSWLLTLQQFLGTLGIPIATNVVFG